MSSRMHFRGVLVGWVLAGVTFATLLSPGTYARPQNPAGDLTLSVDPNASQVHWTLGATVHTVHGSFKIAKGSLQLDPSTGKASGEIVVAATSGESGNDGRDKKMHNEVLESSRYTEIVFRPDHFDGKIAPSGASSVQLHGAFVLHGATHEMTVPVGASLDGSRWTGTCKFSIPYVQWGLKNPSTFILRVKQEVEVELNLQGQIQTGAR